MFANSIAINLHQYTIFISLIYARSPCYHVTVAYHPRVAKSEHLSRRAMEHYEQLTIKFRNAVGIGRPTKTAPSPSYLPLMNCMVLFTNSLKASEDQYFFLTSTLFLTKVF